MARRNGHSARTVEQTVSIDIDELRRAGYVGTASTNWWVHRNELYSAGIQPRHWNDNAITLDNQNSPRHAPTVAFRRPAGLFSVRLRTKGRQAVSSHWPPVALPEVLRLTYATKQSAPRPRLILKAQKIRELLGGKLGVLDLSGQAEGDALAEV